MEWKRIGEGSLEIGNYYLVVTDEGKYQVRRYVRGWTRPGNMLTEDLSIKPSGDTWIDEGFIACGGPMGRKTRNPLFYTEIPELPELTEAEKIKSEISRLKARLYQIEKEEGGKKWEND